MLLLIKQGRAREATDPKTNNAYKTIHNDPDSDLTFSQKTELPE